MCHTISWYAKTNGKYMKDYNKNKELSYLKYWDVNNFYGRVMSQKLPVNDFNRVEDISGFNEDFIKSYNDESVKEYFLEADVQYCENLHNLYNALPFLIKTMNIEKVEKTVVNLQDKTKYVTHIWNLKQALNHGLEFKKVCRPLNFIKKLG